MERYGDHRYGRAIAEAGLAASLLARGQADAGQRHLEQSFATLDRVRPVPWKYWFDVKRITHEYDRAGQTEQGSALKSLLGLQ